MKEQEKINSLIEVCHKAAKDKGFWDEPRNQDEAFALILSELFEAFEAHRKGRFADLRMFENLTFENKQMSTKVLFEKHIKDSFEDEIADTFVRLFDYCAGFGVTLGYREFGIIEAVTDNFGQTVLNIVFMVSKERFTHAEVWSVSMLYYLLLLIVEKYNIDILAHIELKLKYNSLMAYKHGKKY